MLEIRMATWWRHFAYLISLLLNSKLLVKLQTWSATGTHNTSKIDGVLIGRGLIQNGDDILLLLLYTLFLNVDGWFVCERTKANVDRSSRARNCADTKDRDGSHSEFIFICGGPWRRGIKSTSAPPHLLSDIFSLFHRSKEVHIATVLIERCNNWSITYRRNSKPWLLLQ